MLLVDPLHPVRTLRVCTQQLHFSGLQMVCIWQDGWPAWCWACVLPQPPTIYLGVPCSIATVHNGTPCAKSLPVCRFGLDLMVCDPARCVAVLTTGMPRCKKMPLGGLRGGGGGGLGCCATPSPQGAVPGARTSRRVNLVSSVPGDIDFRDSLIKPFCTGGIAGLSWKWLDLQLNIWNCQQCIFRFATSIRGMGLPKLHRSWCTVLLGPCHCCGNVYRAS